VHAFTHGAAAHRRLGIIVLSAACAAAALLLMTPRDSEAHSRHVVRQHHHQQHHAKRHHRARHARRAAAGAAALAVSPTQGTPGSSVTATGTNYARRSTGSITFGGTSVARYTANGSGRWTKTFTVPQDPNAAFTVQAGSATTTFTVTNSSSVDTTPPSAPTSVVASGGDAQVTLGWSANAESDLAGYRVYRNGVRVGSPTTTSFTDSGLSNGTSYTYYVTAVDTSGNESAHSATVSATPRASTSGGSTPPPIAGNWALKLNDEFTSLDTNRWVQRYWWNGDTFWPTSELQAFRPANVTANGVLTLTAQRQSGLTNFMGSTTNSVGETFCCSSGLVSSGGIKNVAPVGYAFTYGYVEARIWIPSGAGTWPAFWMQRADYNDSAEMDIMEVIGRDPNTLQMHYHGPAGTFGGSYTASSPLSGGWHTYALDWEPGKLVWYLDGVPRYTHTGSDVDSFAHYIMLNLTIGGSQSWGGAPDSNTPFPSNMRVDWLRVWQSS
jgi:beta-glucanase (GH16 family)